MQIRQVEPGDEHAVWNILKPIFRAGKTYCLARDVSRAEGLRYWSGGNHKAFVQEDGSQMLGTYFLCPNQGGGGAHVANAGFATAAAAQGKGVARAMLAHAMDTARGIGFRAMQFNFVISTNTRAIALWKSAGFDTVGRLPGAFEHPTDGFVDALIMYRDL
ncbi:MAG: GNAT family N-acetyltransferase [Pseudomonadota bacterium]